MALVEFQISKSKYRIQCPEDEKQKILDLAKIVDKRIKKLAGHFDKADDKTLMAISCLTMEDEIQNSEQKSGIKSSTKNSEENFSQGLEEVLKQIESVAKKIEKY